LRAPAPQAGVSTNFTIWAVDLKRRKGVRAQRLNGFIPQNLIIQKNYSI